ncbi:MAG: CDGSH iron-sulfur domain-containing protein [Gammaproteobacteria bacterium]|nr:CDGSH iron-sulfur domain-containing protein [Gammaproteobacteria bacterium]MDH3857556.1 CDGSH iron-sulfur domain-containing protein [Gammaproteobacteria bacterium]
MNKIRPAISCAKNGPYLLKSEAMSAVELCVPGPEGETVSSVSDVALCRCGGSSNKPFCDGTHRKNSFNDRNESDTGENRVASYSGTHLSIHDNRSICAHAGYCTDQLSAVFKMSSNPWIDPDGASVEEIIALVNQCPSGALSYTTNSETREQTSESRIRVMKDGPYAISGVDLADHELGAGATSARFTLCRCGASKNKPFCDGSHWDIDFKG